MDGSGGSGSDGSDPGLRELEWPSTTGGVAAGLKRLAMPETTIPGCKPRRGASRDMVPRIR